MQSDLAALKYRAGADCENQQVGIAAIIAFALVIDTLFFTASRADRAVRPAPLFHVAPRRIGVGEHFK